MEIRKITNGNVYMGKGLSLLGKAKQVTLPELVAVTETHQALGMIGKIEYMVGLETMLTKITWHGFYPEQFEGANFLAAQNLQVRAAVQSFGAGGIEETVPLVVLLTASWKKIPLPVIAPAASSDTENELSTTYCKVTLAGVPLVEIDVHKNIWRVKGKDVLAEYRAAMGG